MGRKMAMRGRPGLLFLALVVIFIIIFLISWKSLKTSTEKSEVKDIYSSVHLDALRRKEQINQDHPAYNVFQSGGKGSYSQDNLDDKELQYHLGKDFLIERAKMDVKMNSHDPNSKSHNDESPLSALLHPESSDNAKSSGGSQNCKSVVEGEPFYHEPDPSFQSVFDPLQRLVHLDLKGSPPKFSYYQVLFPLLTKLGATGLLIEYEDMFPYSGDLKEISANNSYSSREIEEILTLAQKNSLSVIPLIQTFGHMEFVLKSLHWREARESDYTPQVINVASEMSYDLIRKMVKQVLATHPSAKYMHVGCDEVYEIGKGKSADIMIKEKIKKEHLFLRHVKRVAQIVADESKGKVRPIIWDDELRNISEADIKDAGLPSHVDIMVWNYLVNISKEIDDNTWKKYGKLFQSIWAASSFKGATGPRQIYADPLYHIRNHFSWIEAMKKYRGSLNFKGIALTGWSRFDHFGTLCELFPVAIPSLSVCLATIKNGGFNKDIRAKIGKYLECSNPIQMSFPQINPKSRKAIVTQDCRFPGHMLYYAMQQLWGHRQNGIGDKGTGWLSDYQISHHFSNPGQLKVMFMKLAEQHANFLQISSVIESEMNKIYFPDTVEEWMDENIYEQIRHIKETQEKIKNLQTNVHWEKRPLKRVHKMPPNTNVLLTQTDLKTQQSYRIVSNTQNRLRSLPQNTGLKHDEPGQMLPVKTNAGNIPNAGFDIHNTGIRQILPAQNNKLPSGLNSLKNSKMVNLPNLPGGNVREVNVPSQNAMKSLNENSQRKTQSLVKQPGLNPLTQVNSLKTDMHAGDKLQPVLNPANAYKSKDIGLFRKKDSEVNEKRDISFDNFQSKSHIQSRLSPQESFSQKNLDSSEKFGHPEKSDNIPIDHLLRDFKDTRLVRPNNVRQDDIEKLQSNLENDRNLLKPDTENEEEELESENNDIMSENGIDTNDKENLLNVMNRNAKNSRFPNNENGGLSPGFVEALRRQQSETVLSNQDEINKALFQGQKSVD